MQAPSPSEGVVSLAGFEPRMEPQSRYANVKEDTWRSC
jgi:hypothetical protein